MRQSRTCARRTLHGQQGGVACAQKATTSSGRLLKRPTSCTPLATCSRNRSSRSPLPKILWNGPWQKRQTMRTTRPSQTPGVQRWTATLHAVVPSTRIEACPKCSNRLAVIISLTLVKYHAHWNKFERFRPFFWFLTRRIRIEFCRRGN